MESTTLNRLMLLFWLADRPVSAVLKARGEDLIYRLSREGFENNRTSFAATKS